MSWLSLTADGIERALVILAEPFKEGGWPFAAFFIVLLLRSGLNRFFAEIVSVEAGGVKVERERRTLERPKERPDDVRVRPLG